MTQIQKYEKQRNYFENLLRNGSLGHAYLFTGQDAAGKKLFAEDICTLLTGKGFDNNPDLKFIRPDIEKDDYKIYIEDIRSLKSFMALKPHSSEYKLAVIDNADAMTLEAANAILKILEEPPKRSTLILISSKQGVLPKTILSRCEAVVFPPIKEVETDEMAKVLSDLRKVAKQSMAERIQYAKKIYEKDNYAELVNLWLPSLHIQFILSLSKDEYKPASAPVLRRLLNLSHIVSQPQYNHRIALENFFVNL